MSIKRTMSIGSLIVFTVAVVWAGTLFAQGPGYGLGGGSCPGWRGKSSGMGPGMMGQGYGLQYQQPQKPITKSDAESMLQDYVSRNPNLKVGTVQDEGNSFEANVTTKDGSLVNKLFVDKDTGRIRSEY
jgi:hypothetical protein